MNKSIKIALLVVAFVIVVGAVIYFADTVLGPPGKPAKVNQYTEAISSDIKALENASESKRNTDFQSILNLIEFQKKNNLIDASQSDKALKELVAAYVPKFVSESNGRFGKSVWDKGEMSFISSRIAELNMLKLSDGKSPLSSDEQKQLSQVSGIIGEYNAAWNVANSTNYSNASSLISSANRYKNMSPIKNCSALVSALNSLPSRLGSAHHSAVLSRINSFLNANSYTMSYSAAQHTGNELNNLIDAYSSNSNLYPNYQSLEGYRSSISSKVREVYMNSDTE